MTWIQSFWTRNLYLTCKKCQSSIYPATLENLGQLGKIREVYLLPWKNRLDCAHFKRNVYKAELYSKQHCFFKTWALCLKCSAWDGFVCLLTRKTKKFINRKQNHDQTTFIFWSYDIIRMPNYCYPKVTLEGRIRTEDQRQTTRDRPPKQWIENIKSSRAVKELV